MGTSIENPHDRSLILAVYPLDRDVSDHPIIRILCLLGISTVLCRAGFKTDHRAIEIGSRIMGVKEIV